MTTTLEAITQEWGHEEGPRLLQLERATASVRAELMATWIHGGKTSLKRYREVHGLIEDDPVFDREDRYHQSQVERYNRGCEKAVHLVKKMEQLGLNYDDLTACNVAVDDILPVDVHMKMVIPALMYQTTPQQREHYLPLAKSFRLLGAYAQTELGHGSNVRGLETTATYDPHSQTFVLHSPTLTSLKWWPGGLGKTATHALVVARLIIGNQDYGVHSFIVQIRSLRDHRPLTGVTTGDIGPKLGFQSVDNGFLRLQHVRVPRDAMLMGQASVSPDGTYRKAPPGADKLVYGAMLDVRAGLVAKAATTLARAVTIAIRYSAVRAQGFVKQQDNDSAFIKKELQVLDYPTQQHILMPLLATAYALQATGRFMTQRYKDYTATLDTTLLPEVHALSSGLKALVATVVSDGVEACRKMCGGHGYSNFSGLPEVVNNYVAVSTFEGTQQVLEPQLARFLLRVAMSAFKKDKSRASASTAKGEMSSDLDYIIRTQELLKTRSPVSCPKDLLNTQYQLLAFEARAAAALEQAVREVQSSGEDQGEWLGDALSACGVSLGKLSRAHCQLVILRKFHQEVSQFEDQSRRGQMDPEIELGVSELRVLRDLAHLFALSTMEKDMAAFRLADHINAQQAQLVTQQVARLCRVIRHEAVVLVDSWMMSDKLLNSALGRSDGRVYAALLSLALNSPLNKSHVTESYHRHLVRLIHGQPSPKL